MKKRTTIGSTLPLLAVAGAHAHPGSDVPALHMVEHLTLGLVLIVSLALVVVAARAWRARRRR